GRTRGVNRTEHQVAGFGRVDGRQKRFFVTHFADEHHVGVFTHGVLHTDLEVNHIKPDLALVDKALIFGEDEFDRVFERQDVLAVLMVDQVEHRRDGRALAGTGDAGKQHHALIVMAKLFDRGRQKEALEVGDNAIHAPGNHADVAKLLQQVY